MVLTEYTYVFAIGTMFALLEAYNNGASTSSPIYIAFLGRVD
jgi:sodium-dependent phosphate transporter